jgi:hypothetical protein
MNITTRFSNGWRLMTESFSYLFKKELWLIYTLVGSCILSFLCMLGQQTSFIHQLLHTLLQESTAASTTKSGLTPTFLDSIISTVISAFLFVPFIAMLYLYIIRDLENKKISFYTSWLQTKTHLKNILLWQLFLVPILIFTQHMEIRYPQAVPITGFLWHFAIVFWSLAIAFVLPILTTTPLGIFRALSRSTSIAINTFIETIAGFVVLVVNLVPLIAGLYLSENLAVNTKLSSLSLWLINTVLICATLAFFLICMIFTSALYLYAQDTLKDTSSHDKIVKEIPDNQDTDI